MAKNCIKIDSKALEKQLKDALKRNPQVTAKTVKNIALDLAGRSAQLAPIESGDLRNNCNADINGITIYENQTVAGNAPPSLKAVAEVGYSLPYALRQHEDLTLNHSKTNGSIRNNTIRFQTTNGQIHEYKGASTVNRVAGGQAKFLEKPFLDNEQKYIDALKSIPDKVIK